MLNSLGSGLVNRGRRRIGDGTGIPRLGVVGDPMPLIADGGLHVGVAGHGGLSFEESEHGFLRLHLTGLLSAIYTAGQGMSTDIPETLRLSSRRNA